MHHQGRNGVTFGDVVRVREYRAIWLADAQSIAGDQIARVSLAILVFERTGSTGLTALVYALTYMPAIVGGTFLAGIADRFPRRDVMVCCDLIRAVLFGVVAIPIAAGRHVRDHRARGTHDLAVLRRRVRADADDPGRPRGV